MRRVEEIRDRVMLGLGTDEPLILDDGLVMATTITRQWRKPLSIPEVNQLPPTAEVRARPGRP